MARDPKLTAAQKAARDLLAQEPETDDQLLQRDRARAKAQRHAREGKRVIRALEGELSEYRTRLAYLDELSEAPDPKPMKVRAKKKKQALPEANYVMCASDWHVGERVRPETVGHRNEYSPEIAEERAAQFFKSNLLMLNASRSAWTISDAVLWLGGDLMTGWIHEEYEAENFLSPTEEALLAFRLINDGITKLLAESDLEKIRVPTSYGNHGRTGKKIRVAGGARNSYEWMLYQFLAMRWADEPRLEWQIASGYNNVVDLYGMRINFHHGDAVGYAGGIGGVTIPVNRRIGRVAQGVPQRWEGTEKAAPHLYVNGHFHEFMAPRSFVQNGSLIGWNDFAERIGCPFQDPQQASFVVDSRYKVVSHLSPILVTKAGK